MASNRKDVTIDNKIDDLPKIDNESRRPIYLDYNATTPILPEIKNVMQQAVDHAWANPSSTNHILGRTSRRWLNWAREQVGACLNVSDPNTEIIFTSGGTESNNWILNYIASMKPSSSTLPHVITTAIEHPAISQPLKALSRAGLLTYTIIHPIPRVGSITAEQVADALQDNTVLVTVMAANNETGVIQPIEQIGQLVREINTARQMQADESDNPSEYVPLFYHIDAAQIIGKGVLTEPGKVDVKSWCAHYVTIVGHKFYGPRIGALYVKQGIPLAPWLHGGGQEMGKRSGTENVMDCVGLGAACQISKKNNEKIGNRLLSLRVFLERQLMAMFNELTPADSKLSIQSIKENIEKSKSNSKTNPVIINFQATKRLPNTVNVSFMNIPKGKTSNDLVKRISDKVIVSTGAACKTDSSSASQILLACGVSEEAASRAVRISLGRESEADDLVKMVEIIREEILEMIREAKSEKEEDGEVELQENMDKLELEQVNLEKIIEQNETVIETVNRVLVSEKVDNSRSVLKPELKPKPEVRPKPVTVNESVNTSENKMENKMENKTDNEVKSEPEKKNIEKSSPRVGNRSKTGFKSEFVKNIASMLNENQ